MSSALKTFVSKLKNRRKSRLWRHRKAGEVQEEGGGEEASALAEQMASLDLTSSEADPAACDPNSEMPHVFGSQEFKYDFDLPSVYRAWPGPSYDENSQFAPGIFDKPRHPKRRPRQNSSKRRLSHDERSAIQRRDERAAAQTAKAVTRTTKTSRQPQYYGSPPPRDPPNHLLNLPGEIRNEVHRILCLSDEPISAQFRLIIKPRQGRADRAHEIRRLPLEPSMALVCRKLQQEVLSLFYSENKFVFHRSEHPKLSGMANYLSMTRDESITKWTPKFGVADSLRHVEVHFKARDPTFRAFSVAYTVSKLSNEKFCVSNNVDSNEYCTCFEKRVLQRLRSDLESDDHSKNLVQLAARLSLDRRAALQEDVSMSADFPYMIYRPVRGTCNDCGLEHLREIASGL